MKKILSCLFILQMFFLNHVSSATTHAKDTGQIPIATYDEDVTNDGYKESIELRGKSLSDTSDYFQRISVVIQTNDSKEWVLNFLGGYQPNILFLDLTHNGANDLFYKSAKQNNMEPYEQHLYTFIKQQLTEIPLPKHPYIEGKFQDDFQIHVQLSPLGGTKPVTFSIGHQSDKYIEASIYHQNGKLLKGKRMIFDPISYYEPIRIGKEKGYGLISYQHGYGIDRTDHLGTVETLWYYENERWVMLQTNWTSL